MVPKRHNVEEKGDGCGENVEDSDSDDGDEEEEDSDEDEDDEEGEEDEEDEDRDTSLEGPSSNQDSSSENPPVKTSSHVSLTLL